MAEGPEHRPVTERANGGAEGATPCSPTDQWQRAPAPGPPQPVEEAGRRPLAPPRSPLTRCLVALSSCSKPRGRVGGRRGPCRVPSSRPSADCAHMATQAHSLSYAGCNFLRQRLVLSTLSGRPVKIRRIRARDDNPGLRGDWGGGVEGGDPGSPSRAVAGRVGGLVVGRSERRVWSELRHAWNDSLRLPGAGSKQLHVFLAGVLLRIVGVTHALPSLETLAFAINLSKEKKIVY